MPYNLAQPYSRSFKGPIDTSLVFQTTQARTDWLASAAGIAIGYSGMIVSDLETQKAYMLHSNSWVEITSDTYTHPTNGADTTIEAANTKVLSAITVDSLGHVTAVSSKNLTQDDIPTLSQGKITNLTTDLSNKLSLSGGTMSGFLTLSGNPTQTNHAATKGYVDAVKQGLDIKDSVRVATTSNLAVSSSASNVLTAQSNGTSLNTIDGILLVVGNRILVKNQNGSSGSASAGHNGIYTVTQLGTESSPLVLTRATDADTANTKVTPGMFTFVEEGDINGDTGWVLTNNGNITLGSVTDLVFSQFSAAGQIYDGSGLYKLGNTIHVGQGDGISVLENSVAVNSTVLRTSGVQTITGDKDFGNNLLLRPTKNATASYFPAFEFEPNSSSQKLTYMTKAELVTALSFETPDLGNSFVNTTGNQSISGLKTFSEPGFFNGYSGIGTINGSFQPVTNINLTNSSRNCITFNGAGSSPPPANSTTIGDGTKIVFKPSVLLTTPPVAIGVSSTDLWHQLPSASWNYSWYVAGGIKIAALSGNGTFETTTLKSTNLYINNTQVNATATELNLLASASDKDILIGNGTDFVKQNFITALSGAIISQSGLTISNNASNLIINHNLSSATSTSNSNPNVIQNILLDDYGHITGVSNVNLDDIYLTSSDLNTQISFVSGIGSYYNTSNSGLTVFHSGGNPELTAGSYGGDGIKSITLDDYGHITNISTPSSAYIASGDLCTAISDCTIDGGTY